MPWIWISVGNRKLALAAAVIHGPKVLFLDEPFEGVDAVASGTLKTMLQRMISRGVTIFLTSHVLEIVERLCTHVGIINNGRLVAQGPLDELRSHFDLVVIDAPPWDARPDIAALSAWCDGIYLTVSHDSVEAPQTDKLLQAIRRNGAPLRGCILHWHSSRTAL